MVAVGEGLFEMVEGREVVGERSGVLRRWSTIGCCWGWIDRIVKDFGRWADARTVGACGLGVGLAPGT